MCTEQSALNADLPMTYPDLPMAHCSVRGLDDERLLLPFAPELLHVVLELSILCREDPGFGSEAVFLRLAFNHPERLKRKIRK